MAYVLDQLVQTEVAPESVGSDTNRSYMTIISDGEVVSAPDTSKTWLYVSSGFSPNTVYYFHAKVKKQSSEQVFYIYLINKDATGINDKKQYLKTLNVAQTTPLNEWIDVEIIFTPYINDFNTISFELQGSVSSVTPIICFEELDEVINKLNNRELIKMGVQSTPGLSMVLNGESIYVGRSGIYEIKDNSVFINFFSVVSAGIENGTFPGGKTFEQYLNELIQSDCIFNHAKIRGITAYVLDYIYNEEV